MSPNRKMIETFGRKRRPGYVRVFRETVGGNSLVRVQWTQPASKQEPARITTESFPDSRKGIADAKAFAEGVHEGLTGQKVVAAPPAPISVHGLYDAYTTAKSTEWSENTLRLSNERWGKFELFIGKHTDASSVTREKLDELKKALVEVGRAPNQVKHVLKEVVRVYLWGVDRDLIPPTKLTSYQVKFRRGAAATGPTMGEYSFEERMAIIAHLDPREKLEWRPWVANVVLAFCGPRADALLQLELRDVELAPPLWTDEGPVFAGMIRWRAETDKMGTERVQPMPGPVAEALWVALGWRQYDRYPGRFIFYGAQRRTRGAALRRHDQHHAATRTTLDGVQVNEKPWTYSALIGAIHRAEKRAGIEHVKYRGAHAHRRGVAGDVHDATGSEKAAAEWIGDRSVKVVRDRYLLERAERLKGTAALMGGDRNIPQPDTTKGPETPSEPSESNLNGEPAVGIEPTTARLRSE